MLTLPIPAAPRLRRTFRNARCRRSRVILPVNEWALILVLLGPWWWNPHEIETLGSTSRPARGGGFLANRRAARVRIGRPVAGLTPRANWPHGLVVSSVLAHGCPFRPGGLLRGSCCPRGGGRWGRRPHRRMTRPFRHAYGSGLPWGNQGRRGTFTGQRGQPLCPGEPTTHPDGPRFSSVASAASGRWADDRGASAGLGAWHTVRAETWPLPNYPCLAPSSPPITGRRWLRTSPRGEFEQGFPHGYGPARVGLDRSVWDRSHRL